jgi:cell division protein FtsB
LCVKNFYTVIKNKYFVSTILLVFYILLLHDTDIASLNNRKQHVQQLKIEITQKKKQIEDLKISLNELENINSLEKFAREKYFFKKDDEDLFILSYK